jgi:hypothetical protein
MKNPISKSLLISSVIAAALINAAPTFAQGKKMDNATTESDSSLFDKEKSMGLLRIDTSFNAALAPHDLEKMKAMRGKILSPGGEKDLVTEFQQMWSNTPFGEGFNFNFGDEGMLSDFFSGSMGGRYDEATIAKAEKLTEKDKEQLQKTIQEKRDKIALLQKELKAEQNLLGAAAWRANQKNVGSKPSKSMSSVNTSDIATLLEEKGLIDRNGSYSISYQNGTLTVNGEVQSKEITEEVMKNSPNMASFSITVKK